MSSMTTLLVDERNDAHLEQLDEGPNMPGFQAEDSRALTNHQPVDTFLPHENGH